MDKIICLGKNYHEHNAELHEPTPDKPVIFLKPPSVLKQATQWGQTISAIFPDKFTDNVQPECEVVLRLARGGYNMSVSDATAALDAVAIGLDMTLRSHQAQLKKAGNPWTTGKVFRDAAILSPWLNVAEFNDFMTVPFSLAINGTVRQHATADQMVMQPIDLIVYASQFLPLCAGDILFTGTPAGVSAIRAGDSAELCWGSYRYSVIWNQ